MRFSLFWGRYLLSGQHWLCLLKVDSRLSPFRFFIVGLSVYSTFFIILRQKKSIRLEKKVIQLENFFIRLENFSTKTRFFFVRQEKFLCGRGISLSTCFPAVFIVRARLASCADFPLRLFFLRRHCSACCFRPVHGALSLVSVPDGCPVV